MTALAPRLGIGVSQSTLAQATWQAAPSFQAPLADGPGVKNPLALLRTMNLDHDVLAEYRQGIVLRLSVLGGVALVLITLVHLAASRWGLVMLNLSVSSVLLLGAWRLAHGGRPLMPFAVLVALMIGAILLSVHLQGVPGLLWAYPLAFLCYFALPRRQALVLSGVLLVLVSLMSWQRFGAELAPRVFISLCFVLLMINVVLGVLGKLQQALVTQAITDPLTGSYNRRHLQTHLDRLVPPSEAAQSLGPALLAIDIDHFKRINDHHGHAVGDEVLKRFVHTLSGRQRLGDVLFRTGGEEFMLLLPRTTAADAAQLAEALRALVARSPLLDGETVTVSIGASVLAPGQGVQAWLQAADRALYRAKQQGRDRVEVA